MLLRFSVENYRSIRATQELSFHATSLNDRSAVEVDIRPGGTARVLPAIAIYGPNASGKSNVLRALIELAGRATWLPQRGREPRPEPFRLDTVSAERPSAFEIEFMLDGVRYMYHLAQGDSGVTGEWLHAFPLGRRQVWFERDGESFAFPGDHLKGSTASLTELVRPDAAFLSIGVALRHPQLSPVARWLRHVRPMTGRSADGDRHADGLSPGRLFGGGYAPIATELVRRADLGIVGACFVESGDGDDVRRELRFRHRSVDGDGLLPLSAQSEGTLSWVRVLGVILPALATGGVVVADELDASLHPELVAELVRMFQDPQVNSQRAQLLFAGHDVTLLGGQFGGPLLDRDQIWFTQKDEMSATELFPLHELSPRKGENVERGYLAGRYGATPGLSPGELGRVLRLTPLPRVDEIA